MMTKRYKVLLTVLVISNLFLAGYLLNNRHTGNRVLPLNQTHQLPELELRDDKGQTFNTDRYLGRPLYVQFINSSIEEQIQSFANAYQNIPKNSVNWLIFTNNSKRIKEKLNSVQSDVRIVEEFNTDIRNKFDIPLCCEKWIVFDEKGFLNSSDNYNSGDNLAHLRDVISGQPVDPTAMLAEAISSAKKGLISQIVAKTLNPKKSKAVVVLFSSVCSGCNSGKLINLLTTHYKNSENIDYFALFPHTYTMNEVETFKTNLKVPFTVNIADKEFSEKWSELLGNYGEKRLNGSVLFIEKGSVHVTQDLEAIGAQLSSFEKK